MRRRREEGCLAVEMEAAAFFAVSRYYDLPLAQLLYAGDDVSGAAWDAAAGTAATGCAPTCYTRLWN